LPALPTQTIEGIDLLPKAPLVEDRSNRGTLTGRRREQVSYLFQREGNYTLPAAFISWWNPETKTLEKYELDAKSIYVAPDSLAKISTDEPESWLEKLSSPLLMGVILLIIMGLTVTWQWAHIQAWRKARFNSEPEQFKRAIKACRKNNVKMAWSTTNVWLESTGYALPVDSRDVWQELQRAMVSNTENWSGHALKNILTRLHKNAQGRLNQPVYLKPLNP